MGNIMDARRRILLNTPHIETASGGVANFKTDMIAPLKGCKVNFLPKQSGSGDPSPTNIRPISGWDGVSVTRCGKNLFDASAVIRRDGYRLDDNGTEVSTDVSGYTESLTRVSPNAVYTFRGNISSASYAGRLYFYDRNKNFISRSESIYYDVSHYTFNTPGNCFYIALQYVISVVDFSTIQIEKGQLTAYEPYTASTFPISWTQQGTAYGGYVDLVSGELVKEWELIELDDLSWEYSATYDWFYSTSLRNIIKKPETSVMLADAICSSYTIISQNDNTRKKGISIWTSGNISYLNSGEYASTEDFVSAVSGVQLIYKLATPTLITTLIPQQLKTLKGVNNIYSDADSAEVKFWTH